MTKLQINFIDAADKKTSKSFDKINDEKTSTKLIELTNAYKKLVTYASINANRIVTTALAL